MPEMGAAAGTAGLGAPHAEGIVLGQHDCIAVGGGVEARPAAVGLELLGRPEQLGAARPAAVDALGSGVGVLAGPRRLGAGLPEDAVLLGAEELPPLRVGSLELLHGAETTAGRQRYR